MTDRDARDDRLVEMARAADATAESQIQHAWLSADIVAMYKLRAADIRSALTELARLREAVRMHEEREAPTPAEIAAGWPHYDGETRWPYTDDAPTKDQAGGESG